MHAYVTANSTIEIYTDNDPIKFSSRCDGFVKENSFDGVMKIGIAST